MMTESSGPRKMPFSRIGQIVSPVPARLMQRLVIENDLRTGVDIGCGESSVLKPLRSERFRSIGLDAFPSTIESCRAKNTHDDYICADFLKQDINEQFDVVVLNHVIEHFDRDTGMEVIRRLEKMARRLIYIGTPTGFIEQMGYGGNPFQRHLSGWFPHDFESRGYNVFGCGPKLFRGVQGRPRYLPHKVVVFIERATRWYYFRRPAGTSQFCAIKYIDAEGNVRQIHGC